jgi:hypothetical protein
MADAERSRGEAALAALDSADATPLRLVQAWCYVLAAGDLTGAVWLALDVHAVTGAAFVAMCLCTLGGLLLLIWAAVVVVRLSPTHVVDLLDLPQERPLSRFRLPPDWRGRHSPDYLRLFADVRTATSPETVLLLFGHANLHSLLKEAGERRKRILGIERDLAGDGLRTGSTAPDAKDSAGSADLEALEALARDVDGGCDAFVHWVAATGHRRAVQTGARSTAGAGALLILAAALFLGIVAGLQHPDSPAMSWGEQVWVDIRAGSPAWVEARDKCPSLSAQYPEGQDITNIHALIALEPMGGQTMDGPFSVWASDARCSGISLTIGSRQGHYSEVPPTQPSVSPSVPQDATSSVTAVPSPAVTAQPPTPLAAS